MTPLSQGGLDLAPFEDTYRLAAFTVIRFSSFTAHALIFGTAALALLVLRPAFQTAYDADDGGARARVSQRLEGFVQASIVAAAVAAAAALLLQTLLVAEAQGGDLTMEAFTSTLGSSFARWQAARLPLLVALGVMLIGRVHSSVLAGSGDGRRGPSTLWWGAWLALGASLLVTSTFSGHAAVATPYTLAAINDFLHLVFGAIWLCGIVVLAVVLPEGWRGRPPEDRVRILAPSVVRFSTVAAVSVALLAVTGTLNSFLHVGAVDDLVDSGYGRTLLIKVVLFGAILALGAVNHFVIRKRLESASNGAESVDAADTFRRTIAAELVLGLLLMGVTGTLVGLARTRPIEVESSSPSGVTSAPRP